VRAKKPTRIIHSSTLQQTAQTKHGMSLIQFSQTSEKLTLKIPISVGSEIKTLAAAAAATHLCKIRMLDPVTLNIRIPLADDTIQEHTLSLHRGVEANTVKFEYTDNNRTLVVHLDKLYPCCTWNRWGVIAKPVVSAATVSPIKAAAKSEQPCENKRYRCVSSLVFSPKRGTSIYMAVH
jgi:hypothetical protein